MKPRILVVDDEEDICALLAAILTFEGYEVEMARDGAEALERLATRPFDLVFTDRQMPILDGERMVLSLRSAGVRIPVVMMSGSFAHFPLGALVSREVSAALEKPIRAAELLAVVSGIIDRFRPESFSASHARPRSARSRATQGANHLADVPNGSGEQPLPSEQPVTNHHKRKTQMTTIQDPTPANSHPSPPRKTILVVDDDAAVRKGLRGVLVSEGYQVVAARHGREAIQVFRVHPCDLALLDMNMPFRNGWGTIADLRAIRSQLPAIIITARSDQRNVAREAGVELMEKPLDLPLLLKRIGALLTEPTTSALPLGPTLLPA